MNRTKITPEVIVALDVENGEKAIRLVETLGGKIGFFKVGSRLFTAEGPGIVKEIHERGASVFLDLKFHDIPATVAGSVRAACGLGMSMMTLHTMGGIGMMRAASDAAVEAADRFGKPHPMLIGVTVLTSMSKDDLTAVAPFEGDVADLVLRLAVRAKEAGLDGIVSSVDEVSRIKTELGKDFVVVTPGIRPAGSEVGDQKRVATPRMAAESGSDFIVVGRPIIEAPSPADAADAILEEMRGV